MMMAWKEAQQKLSVLNSTATPRTLTDPPTVATEAGEKESVLPALELPALPYGSDENKGASSGVELSGAGATTTSSAYTDTDAFEQTAERVSGTEHNPALEYLTL